jgi:hypothetical protein
MTKECWWIAASTGFPLQHAESSLERYEADAVEKFVLK